VRAGEGVGARRVKVQSTTEAEARPQTPRCSGPSHRRLNLRRYALSDARARARQTRVRRHREQVACFCDPDARGGGAGASGETITGILTESSFWQIKGNEIESP
jgi:hypothetical protein